MRSARDAEIPSHTVPQPVKRLGREGGEDDTTTNTYDSPAAAGAATLLHTAPGDDDTGADKRTEDQMWLAAYIVYRNFV